MNDRLCDEFERSKWTVNPKTGRKIAPTGRVAKKLREECGFTKTAEKPSSRVPTAANCAAIRSKPGVNPITKRTLLVGGPTHKKLLKACAVESALRRVMRQSPSPSPQNKAATIRPKAVAPRAPKSPAPRVLRSRACTDRGFMQVSATCWFNSALNAVLMGDRTGALVRKSIEKLPKNVLDGFRRSGGANSCPLEPGRSHVFKYAYRYFEGLDHLMTPTKRDRPRSAVHAVMGSENRRAIRGLGNRGYHPQRATGSILQAFFPGEHVISTWKDYKKSLTPSTRIVSFQVPSSKGDHYYLRDAMIGRAHPRSFTFNGRKFELSSAILSIVFENGLGHAVAVYRCRGMEYLYDSNVDAAVPFTWTNGISGPGVDRLRLLYRYRYGEVKEAHFSAEFFARV